MNAARQFYAVLLFLALSTTQASAGLIITEVMYYPNPGPDSELFEYIELYNNGTSSIQLSDYKLTHASTGEFGSLSGTLLGGDTIVLYKYVPPFPNGDPYPDGFARFAWSPAETIQSLAVENWQSVSHHLNSPSLTLEEINPVDPLHPYSFSMELFDNFNGDGWPDPEEGYSIYLMSLNDFGPGNWGLTDQLLGTLDSEGSGIGTPGYQVFPTSSPLVPEPTSLAIYACFLAGCLGTRRRRRVSEV